MKKIVKEKLEYRLKYKFMNWSFFAATRSYKRKSTVEKRYTRLIEDQSKPAYSGGLEYAIIESRPIDDWNAEVSWFLEEPKSVSESK